jgi:6 kDa early secretory antigenic target
MAVNQDTIKVNLRSLDDAADSIERAATRIENLLDDLRAHTNAATAAWEGTARDAYQRLQQDWNDTQGELTANLRRIADAVRSTRGRFGDLENRNTSIMGG